MLEAVGVVRPAANAAVLVLRGEHDVRSREELRDVLLELVAENERVVVDVSDAQFVDASFLHNLAEAHEAAAERGGRLVLQLGTAPIVRRALEVSGLLCRLECADSRAAALGDDRTSDPS